MTILLLEHHKVAKEAIIRELGALAAVAKSVGMRSLAGDIRTTRIPKLEKERFHVVVLGEFNHGKSTFINALLGEAILPTGVTPTTAALNHVTWSETRFARAVLKEGATIDLAPGDLEDWVTVTGSRWKEVAYVEVGYPSDLLRGNLTLIDTPGVNDLNEQRAEITYGYVPRADAVVFLLDAGQALKDSEREFLASRVLEGTRDRLIFVLGKMDLLSDAEREAVIEYTRKGLSSLVHEPVVFAISARQWLAGDREKSRVAELLAYLQGLLEHDRGQILLDNAVADATRTANYLQQNLGVKLRACQLDLAELEARIAQVREHLDTSKRALDQLHTRIDAESDAIKAQVGLDLDTFVRSFLAVLPAQIDAADAGDVKAYLPSFIEDKFKEWAELEGHKLARMLEKLAEDIIAVTNENVEAASAALADRLGPADTELDIDVDSFKYDVGVYALGALGTTLFLFVNTLAGGLLTLVAPVLAIVLKSKVAGDIRKQAKEKCPVAIVRAKDAMQPHFDACVNDFAARLSEFVTAAGNSLYKGISEVLDQTIAERRAHAATIEAVRDATQEKLAHVTAAITHLAAVRQELWQHRGKSPAL